MKTKTTNILIHNLAAALSSLLTLVLFVCANTNSCGMVYQPEAPEDLAQFSSIK